MTQEAIARFFETESLAAGKQVKIDLKKRNAVQGVLIRGNDYEDLKAKNFWRVVTEANLEMWKKTGSLQYAKIFNGSDFNKITLLDGKKVA